jgi:hypothetical protein
MASRIRFVCLVAALTAPAFARQAGTPPSQPAPPPLATSAITGIVVDGASGAAVPGAIVSLRASGRVDIGPQPSQLTDDKGRFAFVNLPAHPGYTITVSKFGYLSGGYGRDTEPSDPLRQVPLKDNHWVGSLRVPIWKPGSISGMVRDENGEPVVGVFVRALVRYRLQGRDELAGGPMTVTDDRGAYRMAGLSPGPYVIQVPSVQTSMSAGTALPRVDAQDGVLEMDDTSRLIIGRFPLPPPMSNGRAMAYPIAFHPTSALVSQAMTIDLKYGDDRQNVDVTLTPTPAVRVSGIVDGPAEALTRLTLRLLPAGLENLGHGSETATALVGPDGRFTFLNVPAGSYMLDAPVKISEFTTSRTISARGVNFPGPPGTPGWEILSHAPDGITGLQFGTTNFRGNAADYSARMPLTVGAGDTTGVVVRLRPHLTMTVRFVFDHHPDRPAAATPTWLPLLLDPAGGEAFLGRPSGTFQPDDPGEVRIAGVMPGKYWIRNRGNAAWVLKSVSWKGRDYTTEPIDTTAADDLDGVVVTFTNALTELSGVVRPTGDAKPDEHMVIVFPVEPAQWRNAGLSPARQKGAAVSPTGTYRLTSLPAGTYMLAAIHGRFRMTWQNPDFLAQVARTASTVTLTWGAKTSRDLAVTVVR